MTQTHHGLRPLIGATGLAIVLTARGAFPAEAPEAEKKEKDLPPVVITATMTETEKVKTAASITVIDRAEIERCQYRMLPDALRQVPGLALADRGTPGSVAGIFLRGTKTEHTAVLIDGRPVPANLAGAFNLETTPLDNIERIEVLRGPAASLYGGKTIGGVINIITRSGRGLDKPLSTGFFEAGSYGTFREGLSTLGAAGDLDWAVELGRSDIQGQRINSQFQQSSAAGRFGWQAADALRFEMDARYYDAHVGVPGSRLVGNADDHLQTEFWSLSPRVIWETSECWRQTLTYSFSSFRQVATNFPGLFSPNNRATVRTQWLEYLSEIQPTDNWKLVAGAWLQDMSYARFNDSAGLRDIDQNQTNWAAFVQSQAELLPGLNFLCGLRFDSYSDFEEAVTWRGGISYRVPVTRTLLHANYGTAFSPPSPQDRELALFGNPALATPERSRGYEVGIEQPVPAARLTLRSTYFQNHLRDTYQFLTAFPFTLQPIGRARTRGLESGIDWRPCDCLGVSFNHTWLDADDTGANARLVRRPRHSFSGAITVRPHADVTVDLSALWVIDREDFHPITFAQVDVEDYLLARLAVTWRVCDNLEVFGRIENLFGDDYEEAAGFPALDTGAYAGVRLRF